MWAGGLLRIEAVQSARQWLPLACAWLPLACSLRRLSPSTFQLRDAVRFPMPHTAFPLLYIYVSACNQVGCSEPVFHRIFPVFLSPPLLSSVSQLQVDAARVWEATRPQAVLLTWRPAAEVSAPRLHSGYLLQWSQPGASADSEAPGQTESESDQWSERWLSVDTRAFNLTGLLPDRLLHVQLFAVMNSSSNYHLQRAPQGVRPIL